MASPTFNFDPYLNTCFREESPDQPLTADGTPQDQPRRNGGVITRNGSTSHV